VALKVFRAFVGRWLPLSIKLFELAVVEVNAEPVPLEPDSPYGEECCCGCCGRCCDVWVALRWFDIANFAALQYRHCGEAG
jgi:hypothetical protein